MGNMFSMKTEAVLLRGILSGINLGYARKSLEILRDKSMLYKES